MSEAAVSSGALAPDISSDIRAARSHLARRFLKNPLGIAALSVLVLIVLAAICAPLLTSYNPNAVSVLSDQTIIELVEAGRIRIDPWDPGLVDRKSTRLNSSHI